MIALVARSDVHLAETLSGCLVEEDPGSPGAMVIACGTEPKANVITSPYAVEAILASAPQYMGRLLVLKYLDAKGTPKARSATFRLREVAKPTPAEVAPAAVPEAPEAPKIGEGLRAFHAVIQALHGRGQAREAERLDRALAELAEEYDRAFAKHPFASLHEAAAVLREEHDELWDEVKKRESERSKQRVFRKAIQVAQVALRTAVEEGQAPLTGREQR
jgi:hypothetical protein